MKLGVSTVMYEESGLSYPEILRRVGSLGYDGVELNFKVWTTELHVEEIKESLDTFDVEIAAIGTRHLYVTHGCYLASPNEGTRSKALSYITDCMVLARKLDCSMVQVRWAFQGSRLEAPREIAWRQAVEGLKEVGRRCRRYGVNVVIEFACKQNAELVNTMDEALRMLEDVGRENVHVMADVFHIHTENDSLRGAVLKGGERLRYVHLADSNRLTPGKGQVDFEEFIDALRDIGYRGYMVMEFDADPIPDESLKQAAQYISQFL